MPPGCAAAETDGRREHLEQEQQCQQARRRHFLIKDSLDHRIADAVDIGVPKGAREHHHHQADDGHAHDVLRVFIAWQFRKAVLHDHEQANEGPSRHAAQDTEQHKGDRLLGAERSSQAKLNVRHRKGRIGANQDPANRGRCTRCDDDGKEGPVGNFRQQNFQRKQHTAERRVEGRRDPCSGACRK